MAMFGKKSRPQFRGTPASALTYVLLSEAPRRAIAYIKENAPINGFEKIIELLNGDTRTKQYLVGTPIRRELSIENNYPAVIGKKLPEALSWHSSILKLYAAEINRFIEYKNIIEKKVVTEQLPSALQEIDRLEVGLGYSLWGVETKIALLQEMEGIEAQRNYANEIRGATRDKDSLFDLLVYYLSVRSEPNVEYENFDSTLRSLVDELRTLGLSSTQTFFEFRLLPFAVLMEDAVLDVLAHDERMPVIDRYESLVRILQHLAFSSSQKTEKVCRHILISLSEHINDFRLTNLLNVLNPVAIVYDDDVIVHHVHNEYTKGNYAEAVRMCEEKLAEEPQCSEIYWTYARASARCESINSNRIIQSLKDLVGVRHQEESYSELLRGCLMYGNFGFAWNVYVAAVAEYSYSQLSTPAEFLFLAWVNSKQFNPYGIIGINDARRKVEVMESYERKYGETPLTQLIASVVYLDANRLCESDIPEHRRLRYEGWIHNKKSEYDLAIHAFERCIEIDPTANDAVVGLIASKLGLSDVKSSASLAVDALLKQPQLARKVPLYEILNEFEHSSSRKDLCGGVDFVILYNFLVKNGEDDYELKLVESYEDFLIASNVVRPSELSLESVELKRLMYFWSNICTPDVMDYSAEFARNSSDIVGERILLCDTLAALDNDRALEYKEERESLTRKLIVQKMASWINATKIYVETDQVRHKLIDSFQEKYQIYKALPERKSSDEISYVTTRIFDFELSTPLKTKDRLLLEMYDYARDVFLRDEKYGLDVALSVEIRHGGLDHITVPLEAGKLLTRRNLQGRYESNMYWNNKYQIYKEGVLKKLDQSLSEFSRKIDRLIDDLKNKILQINYNASRDEVAIFNYDVDDLQLRCIGEQVSRTRNVSEMVDVLINELWDCTDVNLKKAQQYFQSDVRIHVDVIVDELLQQLRLIRGGSGFVELEQTIGSARGNLHTAIDESAGWFKRVTEAELDDCDISVAINVAIDSVQAIYSHKNTHFVIESHCDDVFDGKESRILVNILLILLNNAVKHSGYDVNVPPVTIKIERDNSVLMLSVVNDIGGGVVMEAVVDKLDKAKCDISVGKYSQYTTSEGGSGFYKIAKMVEVDVGGKLSMDYCIQNREISVTIKIDGGLSGASAYC